MRAADQVPTTPAPGCSKVPSTPADCTVDLVVVGSGTGLATALAAHEQGLSVVVVEKAATVGGSTARSGGAFWIPGNPALTRDGSADTTDRGRDYIEHLVPDVAPRARWEAFLEYGGRTVEVLERLTPLRFFWARGDADYHPELPGGDSAGRTCEARPFDLKTLREDRPRLREAAMAAPIPMPVTGADYTWINQMTRTPLKSLPTVAWRLGQGVGGMMLGREYAAGGQALAAGLFAGVLQAGIPVWTNCALTDLVADGAGAITGTRLTCPAPGTGEGDGPGTESGAAPVGQEVTVMARRGLVLATGGFDHDMPRRHHTQSQSLQDFSFGADTNTGDAHTLIERVGGQLAFMEQAWWFPSVAPAGPDAAPQILLTERSLPGSLIVGGADGCRFINESCDYMSFGQEVQRREQGGEAVGDMWLIFDQRYHRSYLFAGQVPPAAPLPSAWYDAGIAARADTPEDLATAIGVDPKALRATIERFNQLAAAGNVEDFGRGRSAYDRYYGDPTNTPNPCLRPLTGGLYAVKIVVSDLGTCGGAMTDAHGRVLTGAGEPIRGLYAQGNAAANIFGDVYPGAGATIAQGLVGGVIIAGHAATSSCAPGLEN